MIRPLKIFILLLFIAFGAIQFVRPERSNPAIDPEKTLEATSEVPEDVTRILKRSCNDCHSNETVYPWYSNVAPVSWSVVDHIRVGREELNFSEWGNYSDDRKRRKLKQICREVESSSMPHYQYLWIHWDAVLAEEDVREVCNWTQLERARIKAGESEG